MPHAADTGASRFPIPRLRPTEPTRFTVLGRTDLTRRPQYDAIRAKEQPESLRVHFHPPLEAGKLQEHVDISVATKDLTLPKEGTREYALTSQYLGKLGAEELAVPTATETVGPYIRKVLETSGLKNSPREEDGLGPMIDLLFNWDDAVRKQFMDNIIIVNSPNGCSNVRSQVPGQEPVEVHTHSGLSESANKYGIIGLALVHKPSFELLRALVSPLMKVPATEWKNVTDEQVYDSLQNAIAHFDPQKAYEKQ